MAKKSKKSNEIDYSDTRNPIELYLAKAIGENVTLPATDNERILVYLRKLIEVIEQGGGGTEVVANPTLAGTESDLTGLQVDETKYKVPTPINVVANPTLAGTEDALTGLQVGNTKYKVSKVVANPTLVGTEASLTGLEVDGVKYKAGGGALYLHRVRGLIGDGEYGDMTFVFLLNTPTSITDMTNLTNKLVTCSGTMGRGGDYVYNCGYIYGSFDYIGKMSAGGDYNSPIDLTLFNVVNDLVTQIL